MSKSITITTIDRVMDSSIITEEPYTFSNIRTSSYTSLYCIDGLRRTFTPKIKPNQDNLDMLSDLYQHSRALIPESCTSLLLHLLPSGGRVLNLTTDYSEFLLACRELSKFSYTTVDAREETKKLMSRIGEVTERLTIVSAMDEIGTESYDIVILDLLNIHTFPKGILKSNGVIIVRGDETTKSSPSFQNCWALTYSNIYGVIGIRNTQSACDALFLMSPETDRIKLPTPDGTSKPFIQRMKTNPTPPILNSSMISHAGKHVTLLGGEPFSCMQTTTGVKSDIGVIRKDSGNIPTAYLGLFKEGGYTLHTFEYNSDTPNRSVVYNSDSFTLVVHKHSTYNSALLHAKYVMDDGILLGNGNDDIVVDLIADGISRTMPLENTMINIYGEYDLLAKGVAKAYSQSDIRILMNSCLPDTLSYIQKTRDGSRIYFSEDIGKQVPSMIVKVEERVIEIEEYTPVQILNMVQSNMPQYAKPGEIPDYVPTSPVEVVAAE